MKWLVVVLIAMLLVPFSASNAAYVRASTGPVVISSVYANEWGSPFVQFASPINAACNGGSGLYLYNVEMTQPPADLRANKMAIVLSAKLSGKRVVLDYFYDAARSPDWDACYIHGIQIVD